MRLLPIITGLIVFIAALAIVATLADLHCTAIRPGDATLVLACRAARLEARR